MILNIQIKSVFLLRHIYGTFYLFQKEKILKKKATFGLNISLKGQQMKDYTQKLSELPKTGNRV